MSKIIIYTEIDGSLAYIIPATEDLTIKQIAEKDVPQGTPYYIVDAADLPADRTYRNAWVWDNGIVVDANKKMEIDQAINAEVEAKATAESKLATLGLTTEDLRALGL